MFNSRVSFFNSTSIYIHEEISNKNTRLAIAYFNSHDSISAEIGPIGTLPDIAVLEQKDFDNEKIIIASDSKIEQIKDISKTAIAEIWVSKPIFNNTMDRAIIMEEWGCGEWTGEGRIFIYEKLNGNWRVNRTVLKWM